MSNQTNFVFLSLQKRKSISVADSAAANRPKPIINKREQGIHEAYIDNPINSRLFHVYDCSSCRSALSGLCVCSPGNTFIWLVWSVAVTLNVSPEHRHPTQNTNSFHRNGSD